MAYGKYILQYMMLQTMQTIRQLSYNFLKLSITLSIAMSVGCSTTFFSPVVPQPRKTPIGIL